MPLVVELDTATERKLRLEAARNGVAAEQLVSELISRAFGDSPGALRESIDPRYLMTLPVEERGRILTSAAEDAAGLYEADLALPVAKRELTAFTALNDDPLSAYSDNAA